MQLKTLLFNRGIMTQNFRNVGWIGIIYFLALFFAIPLQVLMISSTQEHYKQHYLFTAENLFRFSDGFHVILMFTVPVLLAIFLFRYMHVKLSTDYIHSLPIKRVALYHQQLLFGIVMLIIPVLLIGIILLILSGFVDAPKVLNFSLISEWVGTTILINTFVFTAAAFVAMFTGISVFQGVITYILFIFPVGVTVLFFMNVKYFLYGFAADYYLTNNIEKLIPFLRALRLTMEPLTGKEIVFFLLSIIGFYLIGLFAYQKRKVETATQAVAFRSLRPVFLYGVTFCALLLGGMYFGETQGTLGWLIFGYIAASIIGHFIALMILEKSWRVLTKWKGYSLFVGVMIIIALLIKFDVTGYESRIPSLDKIERVYFSEGLYLIDEQAYKYDHDYEYRERYYYKDRDNIENIRKLHEKIIQAHDRVDQFSRNYRNVALAYELDNGKKLVRQYKVPKTFYTEPSELYGEIVESKEHKWNVYGVLRINDATKIDKISITSTRGTQHLTLTNQEDIESFHQTFQTELQEESYTDMNSTRGYWANVEYLLESDQRVYSTWKKSHMQIEQWLEERNLLEQARMTADQIDYAVVIKRDKEHIYEYMHYEKEMKEFENRPDAIRIDNLTQIEECLRVSSWDDSGDYVIAYYFIKGHTTPFFETIAIDNAPSFIKEKLK